jgi:hypothetical protein
MLPVPQPPTKALNLLRLRGGGLGAYASESNLTKQAGTGVAVFRGARG